MRQCTKAGANGCGGTYEQHVEAAGEDLIHPVDVTVRPTNQHTYNRPLGEREDR